MEAATEERIIRKEKRGAEERIILNRSRLYSLLVLIVLVPAPSIGAAMGLVVLADSMWGKVIFSVSKLWLFGVPLLWLVIVEKRRNISWSKPERGGFVVGVVVGVAISVLICGAYWFFGSAVTGPLHINSGGIKEMATETGLDGRWMYVGGAIYWVTVNSLLEEYVWRWFVVRRCEDLMPWFAAVLMSGVFFTLHHIVAMHVYFNWPITLVASGGVFVGGCVWSWMYIRYRSIWPGYVSHAIVDVVVFVIGYMMIFG